MTPLAIEAEGLVKTYALPRQALFRAAPRVAALAGIDLAIPAGSRFGIVGESGSGKSTLARLVVGLEKADAGRLEVLGRRMQGDAGLLSGAAQMVFQDPYGSLDPRQRIGRIVAEPLYRLGDAGERRRRTLEALAEVGLDAKADLGKYPHQFSGGQRKRIAIARALVTRPRLLVADEPVSALDVSIRAQVLNLLRRLPAALTLIVISHDLAVIDYLCDAVAVLYRGRIVEQGAARLLASPLHPYTAALRDAVPRLEPGRRRHRGTRLPERSAPDTPAEPIAAEAGCVYRARCPRALPRCALEQPALTEHAPGRHAACHNPLSLS